MATTLEGPTFYSWDLPTETKVNIDEAIYIITPIELPLLTGLGADGVPMMPSTGVDNTIFYWLEEEVPLPRSVIAEDLDNSETDITLGTGEAVKFAVGDGVRVDDEVMLVTDIDTSTDVLTVVRGSASGTNTTAAAHTTGATILGLGTILVEGSIGSANFQDRDKYFNYTQVFSKKMTASRTAQKIPKYGMPSEWTKQLNDATMHCMQGMEQAFIYGIRHQVIATKRRQTGGLDYYVTTNNDSTSPWMTFNTVETQMSNCWELGGVPDMLMSRPKNFAALTNAEGTERVSTQDVSDGRRGRQRATVLMTEFGDVQLVRTRLTVPSDAFLYRRDQFVQRKFQPLVLQKLAKTDDTDSVFMVAEAGVEVKGQDHMAKFSALNSAAPAPALLI